MVWDRKILQKNHFRDPYVFPDTTLAAILQRDVDPDRPKSRLERRNFVQNLITKLVNALFSTHGEVQGEAAFVKILTCEFF